MISIDKCIGSCNVLSPKIFVIKETKDNSNQKWNNKTCQCECKNYHKCEKVYDWNPSTCISENSKYL